MDYVLTEKQLDRLLKPYFDKEFEDTEYTTTINKGSGTEWTGFYKNISGNLEFMVGFANGDRDNWFVNGPVFNNEWDIFGIDYNNFIQSMSRYLSERFGINIPRMI